MELEDNFDFLSPEDIRIMGTRIGIETILEDFLERGLSPEEISVRYTNLTLRHVYATITYYLFNFSAVRLVFCISEIANYLAKRGVQILIFQAFRRQK